MSEFDTDGEKVETFGVVVVEIETELCGGGHGQLKLCKLHKYPLTSSNNFFRMRADIPVGQLIPRQSAAK